MTGPMVTPDRETLAKALRPLIDDHGSAVYDSTCGTCQHVRLRAERTADALLPLLRTTAADAVRALPELLVARAFFGDDSREARDEAAAALEVLAAALGGES